MRKAMTVVLLGLVLVAGLVLGLGYAWRQGLLGEAALPGPLGTLADHLRAEGIDTHASLVRRGAWDGVRLHARFQSVGERGRSFFVLWCESPEIALRHRDRLLKAPSPSHPQARGELLLYLTDWPENDPATQRVIAAFHRWPLTTGRLPP
jgi:hypothetical protein